MYLSINFSPLVLTFSISVHNFHYFFAVGYLYWFLHPRCSRHPVSLGQSTPSEQCMTGTSLCVSSGLPTPTSHLGMVCHLYSAAVNSPPAASCAEATDGLHPCPSIGVTLLEAHLGRMCLLFSVTSFLM